MNRAALIWLLSLPLAAQAAAEPSADINQARARFNYQMFCQGCHAPDGAGNKGVPQLNGFVGHFLTTPPGRAYLVQVPGSANSTLDDEQLAEVLNWIIVQFGAASIPAGWTAYSSDEVAGYRKRPLLEVEQYRKDLVQTLISESGEPNP